MLQEQADLIKSGDLLVITTSDIDVVKWNKSIIERNLKIPLTLEIGSIITFSHWAEELQTAKRNFFFKCNESVYYLNIEEVEFAEEKLLDDIRVCVNKMNKYIL